jgi:dynein heavy chain
LVKI